MDVFYLQSENPKDIEWHFWKDVEDESTYSMVKLLGKVVGPELGEREGPG